MFYTFSEPSKTSFKSGSFGVTPLLIYTIASCFHRKSILKIIPCISLDKSYPHFVNNNSPGKGLKVTEFGYKREGLKELTHQLTKLNGKDKCPVTHFM